MYSGDVSQREGMAPLLLLQIIINDDSEPSDSL
jgi:hypothetical protein